MQGEYQRDLPGRLESAEVTDVCRDLLRIQSVTPPGNERAAAQYVASYLERAGFAVSFLALSETRVSVLARLAGSGGVAGLLFSGHLDVVPTGSQAWVHDPFAAEMTDGTIWGRGASDMKGGLAALLVAARAVAASGVSLRGDLLVAATADEEAGMSGARTVTAAEVGPLQAILIAEPTSNTLGLAERGVLWLEITTYGKTAHGSMPELGHNAVLMMLALLTELDRLHIPYTPHPTLGDFSRSINTIEGGMKTNVVPDRCVATVDFRTVPGQDPMAIVRQVQGLAASLAERIPFLSASTRVLSSLPAVETQPGNPAVRRFMEAVERCSGHAAEIRTVRFATEAAIYVPAWAAPTIIFGPGDPALAHQPDEHIEIAKMAAAARIYATAAAAMLA